MAFKWNCPACDREILVPFESPIKMSSYSTSLCEDCYKKELNNCLKVESEYIEQGILEENGLPFFNDPEGNYFACKLYEGNNKMDNLELYEKFKKVPDGAKKDIIAGRLKGFTDINPMWRIKILTEQFGPCGIGWYYEITKQWIEEGSENQKVAFTNINLYVKVGNEWSKAIPGTGGSSFIAKENRGPYTSDECFKMALTDAISISCKALGIGADVYFEADRNKYNDVPQEDNKQPKPTKPKQQQSSNARLITDKQCQRLYAIGKGKETHVKAILAKYGYSSSKDIKMSDYNNICEEVQQNG